MLGVLRKSQAMLTVRQKVDTKQFINAYHYYQILSVLTLHQPRHINLFPVRCLLVMLTNLMFSGSSFRFHRDVFHIRVSLNVVPVPLSVTLLMERQTDKQTNKQIEAEACVTFFLTSYDRHRRLYLRCNSSFARGPLALFPTRPCIPEEIL